MSPSVAGDLVLALLLPAAGQARTSFFRRVAGFMPAGINPAARGRRWESIPLIAEIHPLRGGVFGTQAATNLAHRLAQPLLVLDEGKAQVAFPGLAEAAARTDGYLRFFEQLHGEVDRPHPLAPLRRIARPDEHARLRPF